MKTLYISDLDGTLLDNTPKTSDFTNDTINFLINNGMCISYATARSLITAKKVTKGLNFAYPLVVHNGTFIVNTDGEILHKNIFNKNDAEDILNTILDEGLSPVVFSLINGEQKFSYLKNKVNKPTNDFLEDRIKDPRNRAVETIEDLFSGEIYYFTLIGDEDKTKKLYNLFKDKYQCYFQRDMYSNEYWLEITDKSATKANAVKQLAQLLLCDSIVAYGDGINDLELFSIADKAYAVENAEKLLKEKATEIISSNIADGVAKHLKMCYYKMKD